MAEKNWTIRRTIERETRIERLRQQLARSGRKVKTIHGAVETAAIIDAALEALERELNSEVGGNK